jgi:hypothetical protein
MFNGKARTLYASFGLATIIRSKLKKSNPDVEREAANGPTSGEIVRPNPAEPVVVVPEVKPEAEPVVAGETVKFVVRIRSMSDKWITLHEPMPNGTIWVYRPHVLAINRLSDGDKTEIVVHLKIARKKGWVA